MLMAYALKVGMKYGKLSYGLFIMAFAWGAAFWAPGPAWSAEPVYCLRCHLGPVSPLGSLSWQGPVAGEREHPCPGVSRAKQELHLSQSLIFSASRALDRYESPAKAETRLELMRIRARFRLSLNRPLWSLDQVIRNQREIREAVTARILRPIWQQQADLRQRWYWRLGAALSGFMALIALVMFWRHKRALADRTVCQAEAGSEDSSAEGVHDEAG